MCSINGIFAYHPAGAAPKAAELLATRDSMRARGPDGSGVWWSANRRCAFGHRRLSILDLSDRATQPMHGKNGETVVITFNGEIYNYPALRAELESDGVQFSSDSDTEILLHLYERDGADMVHRLRGMFAFAIWDGVKRGLFLARDPYGIKPLYTANDGWTFRFASQVKALLAGGCVSREAEPAGVVGFFLLGSVPDPFTIYRDIRALPAGHVQWVDQYGPREPHSYASLAAVTASGHIEQGCVGLSEQVRTAVLKSVRAHLLADVEVGVFLSAGVDSGAILGLMRDAGQTNVRAITLGFDEFRNQPKDEVPLAISMAERYGARHFIRRVGEQEFTDDLPQILEAMDQPSIDGVNTWFVSKAAKEAGLKVALSGLGGDELLAGYPSFSSLPRWRRRFGVLAAVPGFGAFARALLRRVAPGLVRKQPKSLGIFEYSNTWAGAYLLQRGLYLPHELPELMDVGFAQEGLRRLDPVKRIAASLEPNPRAAVSRICLLESANYLRNQLLRDADWAGMAHGVEIRVPLVDSVLLKSLAPVIAQLKPGAGKAALAAAPSVPLPSCVVTRAKTGFGIPTEAWTNRAVGTGTAEPAGLVSRRWSQTVLRALAPPAPPYLSA